MSKKKKYPRSKPRFFKCDYPSCDSVQASRIDIEVSIFRGDDVVLKACKEHSKPIHHAELLKTEKAIKQL
jgi:hypothetical protein